MLHGGRLLALMRPARRRKSPVRLLPSRSCSSGESTASRQPVHLAGVPQRGVPTCGSGERRGGQPLPAPGSRLDRWPGAGRRRGPPHRPHGRRRRGRQLSRPRARLPRLTASGSAMRTPGRRVRWASRKLAGMTTGPRSSQQRKRGPSRQGPARPWLARPRCWIRGWGLRRRWRGARSARYVLAIGDGVGGHTDPGRAGVRCSAGESSSWTGQTTVTWVAAEDANQPWAPNRP